MTRPRCLCGHPDTYHDRLSGSYDKHPDLGKCDVNGCGCALFAHPHPTAADHYRKAEG